MQFSGFTRLAFERKTQVQISKTKPAGSSWDKREDYVMQMHLATEPSKARQALRIRNTQYANRFTFLFKKL